MSSFPGASESVLSRDADSLIPLPDRSLPANSCPSSLQELQNSLTQFPRNLSVLHINAQSLKKHHTEVLNLLSDVTADILLLSETWLKSSISSGIVSVPGYTLFRNDRKILRENRTEKSGGGVAIFVRDDIKTKIIAKSPDKPGIEFLFTEIFLGKKKILIAVVYWPPHTGKLSELEEPLSLHANKYDDVIIMGDFNCDLSYTLSTATSNFIDTFKSHNLQILDLNPTHHLNDSETWIDHLIVSEYSNVVSYGQISVPGISKHDLLFITYSLKCPKYKPKIINYRDYKNLDWFSFQTDSASAPWHNVVDEISLDRKVSCFNNIVRDLFDKHVPWKSRRVTRPAAPWLSEDLKCLMKKRDSLYRRYKLNKTIDTEKEYKKLRNSVKQNIRNAKYRFFFNLFNSNSNTREFWNTLKNLGIKQDKSSQISVDVPLNDLNNYFTNVAKPIEPTLKVKSLQSLASQQPIIQDKLYFHNVSHLEVAKIVSSLKSNANGSDNITAKQLKIILEFSLPALTHIINFSLMTGTFPQTWQTAHVRPLPKSDNALDPSDYRPISILPTLSKVLEKIVRKQIEEFLTKNNLLDNFQSGFRSGRSTQTALLKVTEDMRKTLDDGEVTILTLLDFSKAFDSVDHDILIAKCRNIGFSEPTLSWISKYFENRRQIVVVGDEVSSINNITRGVPQGSVLGPLFFLIYVNDLHNALSSCQYHLYADDLQIYISGKLCEISSLIHRTNCNLASLHKWSMQNGLLLNPKKSQLIIIGSSRSHKLLNNMDIPKVMLDQVAIPRFSQVKNLGIMIDEKLNWEPQVRKVCQKVYAVLHSLKCVGKCLPVKAKETLIKSLLYPHLDYGDIIYNNLNKSLADTLQRVQNACIRFVYDIKKYDHISGYYKSNNILKLEHRRRYHCLSLIYKIINFSSPSYLANVELLTSSRFQEQKLCSIPKSRSVFLNKSFTVSTAKLWNNLPPYVRNCRTLKLFKKRLLNFLLQCYE